MDFDWMQMLKAGLGTLVALLVVVGLFVMFVRDVTQKKHTVLRNFLSTEFREKAERARPYRPYLEGHGTWFDSTATRKVLLMR